MLCATAFERKDSRQQRMSTVPNAGSRTAATERGRPPARPAQAAASPEPSAPPPVPLKASDERRADIKSRRVLLISADVELRASIATRLSAAGYTYTASAELEHAPARIDEQRPAAVIVDLDLNSPAALELFGAIRSRAAARGTLVIVLGPTVDAEAVAVAARHGVTELLPRTVSPELVLLRLAAQLRMSKIMRGRNARDSQLRLLAQSLPDTLLRVDAEGTIQEVVIVGTNGLGLMLQAGGEGRRLDDLLPAPVSGTLAELCAAASGDGAPAETELMRSDGSAFTVIDFRVVPLRPGAALAILRDITRSRDGDGGARGMLHYDPLTGLPNRALFMSRLARALADGPTPSSVAVFRLQVDQFRKIDSSFGPAAADELLTEFGRRLIALTEAAALPGPGRPHNLVMAARLDADAFAVLAVGLEAHPGACAAIAEGIRRRLAEPVVVDGKELRTTVSTGVSLWPENGQDAESLLRNAAMAASDARIDGTARLYTETLRLRSLRGLEIEQQLRRAIETDGLSLSYQPKVDLARGRLLGFEALLRWTAADLGRVSPGEIIPVAEQCGLIGPLGEWVMAQACKDLSGFRHADGSPVAVAVNVSAGQFAGGDLAVTARRIVDKYSVPPALLELELTESALMTDIGRALRIFATLREQGFKLSIDDFGAGYSSLQYLRRLPVHALKLDRSFIKDVADDRKALAVCAAVLTLGRNLGLEVTAEGVETIGQVKALRAHGCSQLQGFLIGEAMPASSVQSWITRGDWRHLVYGSD